ncbi:MAG: GNAT family N-acetyltransferase [Bacteroides sp.]|nr:GNAT family N-acetyltransferase [Bacteroides sp.]
MVTVKIIDKAHEADVNIPNQPFKLFGLILPSYNKGKWEYEVVRFCSENVTEMCFPDENYDFDELSRNSIAIGAYDGDKCIGVAVLQHSMFKYMYLYDLKVNAEHRGKRVGAMLMEKAKETALEQGYRGIYTQGQDNNLGACLVLSE